VRAGDSNAKLANNVLWKMINMNIYNKWADYFRSGATRSNALGARRVLSPESLFQGERN